MPSHYLSRVFLLPNLRLQRTTRSGRFKFLFCETEQARPDCPFCHSPNPRIHQYCERTLKDSIVRGHLYTLKVKLRRFRCAKCHKTFNEQIGGIKPRARLTERMQREIYWACENFKDLKKVRKHTTCGSKTIYQRYYKQLSLKQRQREFTPWPESIGIDEHAFTRNKQRGHRDFVTLIVDHKSKKPRELLPSRINAEMQSMLTHIPGRENVKNITIDLSSGYRSFARDFFPSAKITADKFHVVRLLHPAINRMRKSITGDKRKHPLRKMLLKNGHDLDVFERKAIWRWLENYPELKGVYAAKEAIHRLYRCRGLKKARRSLMSLLDWLALQNISELKTLRRTLMSWKDEILNYFKSGLTNARTEGFNNVAKSIIKSSYGFKNVHNYRLRVLNAR
jgi:transposase